MSLDPVPWLQRQHDSVMLSVRGKGAQYMHEYKEGIAIIGAGLAGLSAAATLADAGLTVTLFERQRTSGGRLGNDRLVDLGAQYFTARHPAFRQVSLEWQSKGWVAEWSPLLYQHDQQHGLRSSADDIQRLVAQPSMAGLAEHLQQGLALQQASISLLQQSGDDEWLLSAADGTRYGPFSAVVLATPADTAADLLVSAPQLQQDVARVRMRPCWSVTLQFEQLLPTLVDACFVRDGPLDWLARNNSKPQRGGRETWVLQSTASWAEQHADCLPEQVTAELSQAMANVMGLTLPTDCVSAAYYWPQARPAEQLKWGALAAPRQNLYVCGDWCLGGRLENAWLSGRQAARALLDR